MSIQEPVSSPFPLPQKVLEAALAAHREAGGGEPKNYIAFMSGLLAGVVTDRGLRDAARILTQPDCVCGGTWSDHQGGTASCSHCNCNVYLAEVPT